MIFVPDVAAALDWYTSIGFEETVRFDDEGIVNFGIVRFGKAEIMINMSGKRGDHDVTLWLDTDKAAELYPVFWTLALAGRVEIEEPINDTFYHARQFAIRDLNGYVLFFIQQLNEG